MSVLSAGTAGAGAGAGAGPGAAVDENTEGLITGFR